MTEPKYDPTQDTVEGVRKYVAENPGEAAAVVAAEAARTDGTEPRKTVLALAPDQPPAQEPTTPPQAPPVAPLPPQGADTPPTAGNEPTGPEGANAGTVVTTPTAPPVPADELNTDVADELAGYYDRVDKLTVDQRAALEAALDDGTAWDTMRDDAVVRARFGAALTQAESQITPQTGTFATPQDVRGDDGRPLGSNDLPPSGKVFTESGDIVDVADVRGESPEGGASPARGEPEGAAVEVEAE